MLVLLSEYLAEAVGVLITETRKRAQRLMSALLESPSRDSRSSAGAFTIKAPTVMIAEVRPLRAVSLATLTCRIISTSPTGGLRRLWSRSPPGSTVRRLRRPGHQTCRCCAVSGDRPGSLQQLDARRVEDSW